jgi:hypothetical protein
MVALNLSVVLCIWAQYSCRFLVRVQIVIILNSNSELGPVYLNILAWFCLDSRIASKPRKNSAPNRFCKESIGIRLNRQMFFQK